MADRAGMERALEKAGLLERCRTLPHGRETHIGRAIYEDGVQLSGGETQRLMLARALYKLELDREIPAEHYAAVAEIIAFVWRRRGR